uniref:Uncharacterized protein n=1 Tax=Tanacetum cinerariifolium TaxID=118510 RepID=A0A6L2N580_TANCI|nr:hypothetical protein [Tanacetum cinerariifolium]
MTKLEKKPNVPLEIESPVPHVIQPFIEELYVITSKIDMFETKFKTPPDSSPITVIDPDDQPMWSSTRNVTPTPSSAIIQIPIPNNFHIKDDPTQGILDARGIFLYNTQNEDDILLNHVGDKELNSIDGVGNRVLTKKMTWVMEEDAWRKNQLISQAYASC